MLQQELRCRIERKLEILRDEKLNIEDETDTNRLLGAEVSETRRSIDAVGVTAQPGLNS